MKKHGSEIELKDLKDIEFTDNGKKAILNKMIQAEGFEKYLAVKFVGTKRFGLDGENLLFLLLSKLLNVEVI